MELRAVIFAFALALVSRFQALLPGCSIDDYRRALEGPAPSYAGLAAANGRLLAYVFYSALGWFELSGPAAHVFGALLLTLALIATGLTACRLWGVNDRLGASIAVICLTALHPYQAEIFTFRAASVVAATALLLSMAALVICDRSRAHWCAAVLTLALALSIYQMPLNYAAMLVLFSVAVPLAAGKLPAGWKTALLRRTALIAASIVVYFALAVAIAKIAGAGLGSRTELIGPSQLGARWGQFMDVASRIFFRSEPIFPIAGKIALIATFGLGFLGLVARAIRGRSLAVRLGPVTAAAAVAAGIPLCVGIVLATSNWWVVPRVVSQTSLFWAGLMAMAYAAAGKRLRRAMAAGLALAILSFIGANERVASDQLQANARDRAQANRIVARLELLPNFQPGMAVILSGGQWGYASPVRSAQGDMNISALYAEWSKIPLLNEVSGYAFTDAPAEVRVKADDSCKSIPKWPAEKSVTTMDSTALVCLPRP